MDRRSFLQKSAQSLALAGLGWPVSCKKNQTGPKDRPNIVFIFADDMGYGDVQAYNEKSRIPTPNLNRIAAEGMTFTDAHTSSAVCSPSRYSALTGRYCWRTWKKSGVLWPPEDKPLIGPDRLTVAGMLKKSGYGTACFGKWHLGIKWGLDEEGKVDFNRPVRYGPVNVGFDEFYGIAGSLDMVPYVFIHNDRPSEQVTDTQPALKFPKFIRKGPRGETFDAQKVLDVLTGKAVTFIKNQSEKETPFFLYLALTSPHKPVWPAERFAGITGLGPYADFVHQTDWTVGQVLSALDETGVADNTLLVFSSDNGSYMYKLKPDGKDHVGDETVQGYFPENHMANAHWRGTKADIWEAGHRVPFLVRWPHKVTEQAVCRETVCLTDLFATFADITGFDIPPKAGEDSFSLLPLLQGTQTSIQRTPVVHHSANGIFSLRRGKWKMVFGNGSGGRQAPVGTPFEKPYFLFDLEKDPRETTNLFKKHPEIALELLQMLEKIRKTGRSRPL